MPLPSVNTNINAVPLDYFLRGVEAAKPSSVANVSSSAAKTLKALDKFTGQQLASAFDAGLSIKDINRLPILQRRQIKVDIMRELNRLQWLDLLTGQNDRHWQNYFIHVDRETHKVSVKGIDNDAGYSHYRTGAVKYTFDKNRSLTFMSQLNDLAKKIAPRNVDAEYQHLLRNLWGQTPRKQ